MLLLVLGIVLWAAAHLFKRLAPQWRASMGTGGLVVTILAALLGLWMMWAGYRQADYVAVYAPPAFLKHVNNLLMFVAAYLLMAWACGAKLGLKLRNPLFTAVKTWALAHLLVRGDLASIVLFGGLMAWAVISVIVLKRTGATRAPRNWGGPKAEALAFVGAIALVGALGGLHSYFGLSAFGG